MEFIGRNAEIMMLARLKQKRSASFVTIRGRRRIEKSRLVQEYAKTFSSFIEIQGLYL